MATAQQNLHNTSSNLSQHAKELAAEAGAVVAQKASEASSFIGRKADDATSAVGARMKSLAGTIRENAPGKGMVEAAGSAVADTLEASGRYLQHHGLTGIGDDVANLIRRNPIPSVLIGISIGYLVARATSGFSRS